MPGVQSGIAFSPPRTVFRPARTGAVLRLLPQMPQPYLSVSGQKNTPTILTHGGRLKFYTSTWVPNTPPPESRHTAVLPPLLQCLSVSVFECCSV